MLLHLVKIQAPRFLWKKKRRSNIVHAITNWWILMWITRKQLSGIGPILQLFRIMFAVTWPLSRKFNLDTRVTTSREVFYDQSFTTVWTSYPFWLEVFFHIIEKQCKNTHKKNFQVFFCPNFCFPKFQERIFSTWGWGCERSFNKVIHK